MRVPGRGTSSRMCSSNRDKGSELAKNGCPWSENTPSSRTSNSATSPPSRSIARTSAGVTPDAARVSSLRRAAMPPSVVIAMRRPLSPLSPLSLTAGNASGNQSHGGETMGAGSRRAMIRIAEAAGGGTSAMAPPSYDWDFAFLWHYRSLIAAGLGVTIAYTIGTILLGLAIGLAAGLLRLSRHKFVTAPLVAYIEIFRC